MSSLLKDEKQLKVCQDIVSKIKTRKRQVDDASDFIQMNSQHCQSEWKDVFMNKQKVQRERNL